MHLGARFGFGVLHEVKFLIHNGFNLSTFDSDSFSGYVGCDLNPSRIMVIVTVKTADRGRSSIRSWGGVEQMFIMSSIAILAKFAMTFCPRPTWFVFLGLFAGD